MDTEVWLLVSDRYQGFQVALCARHLTLALDTHPAKSLIGGQDMDCEECEVEARALENE